MVVRCDMQILAGSATHAFVRFSPFFYRTRTAFVLPPWLSFLLMLSRWNGVSGLDKSPGDIVRVIYAVY